MCIGGSAKPSNGTNVPSSSLPMNASWVKSIVHVLFMPMHLSSVICVWRPNSGLSEIPLKLKQGVGTLSMKCFTLNVVSRLSSALLCLSGHVQDWECMQHPV